MKQKRSRSTEQDFEKRRKRVALFGSLFMVAILFFSTFAYYMIDNSGSTSGQMEYGDYEFSSKDVGSGSFVYVTQINGQEVEFQTLPALAGYVEVAPEAVQLLKNAQQIILSADPNMSIEDAQMVDYARLQLGIAIPKMVNAMTTADARYKLPVVNCTVASPQSPVVEFDLTNETRVSTLGACITIHASQRELLVIKDRLIFEYYDILRDGQVAD